jgi:hypothetical protein
MFSAFLRKRASDLSTTGAVRACGCASPPVMRSYFRLFSLSCISGYPLEKKSRDADVANRRLPERASAPRKTHHGGVLGCKNLTRASTGQGLNNRYCKTHREHHQRHGSPPGLGDGKLQRIWATSTPLPAARIMGAMSRIRTLPAWAGHVLAAGSGSPFQVLHQLAVGVPVDVALTLITHFAHRPWPSAALRLFLVLNPRRPVHGREAGDVRDGVAASEVGDQ